MRLVSLVLLLADLAAAAQTASPVTNIQATQNQGQTFVTWTDAAPGLFGAFYRYNLYRATGLNCPIASTTGTGVSEIQSLLSNNSGMVMGPTPFNQITRQSPANPMSTIPGSTTPLPFWSGLAIETNTATTAACYAVITHDTTGFTEDSPIFAGSNSMTGTVAESAATTIPYLQIPGSNPIRYAGYGYCSSAPGCAPGTGPTAPNYDQPLILKLHGSGGTQSPLGDWWNLYGDSTMGYEDGVASTFSAFIDTSGNQIADGGTPNQVILTPQDRVWSISYDTYGETYWYGYQDIPPFDPDMNPNNCASPPCKHIYQFTQARLTKLLNYIVGYYGSNPHRVIGWSDSMGGDGLTHWGLQQNANLFAAMFMRVPTFGPRNLATSLMLTSYSGNPETITTCPIASPGTACTGNPPPDTNYPGLIDFNVDDNGPAWVANNCRNYLPFISFGAGRQDTTVKNPANGQWLESVNMANALKNCYFAFAFAWNNGTHSNATCIEDILIGLYQNSYSNNVSYPAFTNFSLDSNYGNGTIGNGDCSTGSPGATCYVNYGWTWTPPIDEATSWSTTVSNSQLTSSTCPTTKCSTTATVWVTPRNTQSFKPAPGSTVYWTASGGQGGSVVVSSYGLATVTGIQLTTSATTITFTTTP